MEILGIGMPELLFVALIAILVLGPEDMQKVGRKVGLALRRFMESGTWKAMTDLGNRLRDLPYELAREARADLNPRGGERPVVPSSRYGMWEGEYRTIAPPPKGEPEQKASETSPAEEAAASESDHA